MRNISLTVLISASLLAGCSTYDAVGIPLDMALNLFTDVNKDRGPRSKNPHKDPVRLWKAETSHCIYLEKNVRSLEGSLDNLFDEVEAGQDYVELPTGETYPVNPDWSRVPYEDTPTEKCVAKEDD